MPLKSTHKELDPKLVNKYPKLMIDQEGMIVLFTELTTGIVVSKEEIGFYSKNWIMEDFKDFKGTVTLTSE